MKVIVAALIVVAAQLLPASDPDPGHDPERLAPLLPGMGSHHHAITTAVPMAQRFFDQGLTLAYGFNFQEAERSFREAVRLDPECGMCHWGLAWVLGPNINAAMDPTKNADATEAAQTALALSSDLPKHEQAYINAMQSRYAPQPPTDRGPLDRDRDRWLYLRYIRSGVLE